MVGRLLACGTCGDHCGPRGLIQPPGSRTLPQCLPLAPATQASAVLSAPGPQTLSSCWKDSPSGAACRWLPPLGAEGSRDPGVPAGSSKALLLCRCCQLSPSTPLQPPSQVLGGEGRSPGQSLQRCFSGKGLARLPGMAVCRGGRGEGRAPVTFTCGLLTLAAGSCGGSGSGPEADQRP